MSLTNNQYTITTTPSIIVPANNAAEQVNLHCVGTVYLGDANVSSSNGFLMDNKDKITLQNDGAALYAVTASGTATLYVLSIQKWHRPIFLHYT